MLDYWRFRLAAATKLLRFRFQTIVFLVRFRRSFLLPSLTSCFEQYCLFANLANPGIVAEVRVNALFRKTLTFSPHHLIRSAILTGHEFLIAKTAINVKHCETRER